MAFKTLKYFILCSLLSSQMIFAANIGLVITATGKYISFLDPLLASAEKYFCPNHHVTYYIFTDSNRTSTDNVKYIFQPKLGWPFDTMMRFQSHYLQKNLLQNEDYLFACDADMLFVGVMGGEILGERVATLHAEFIPRNRNSFTYETNPLSTACINEYEGKNYFAGGFYGGTAEEFIKIAQVNTTNIYKDLAKGFIALWHDESHWNRYCIDNPPTIILSGEYCALEGWDIPGIHKLKTVIKNEAEMRAE